MGHRPDRARPPRTDAERDQGNAGLTLRTLLAALALLLTAAQAHTAEVLRDLRYGPDAAQALDVYLPGAKPANAPAIVMVHGGAWTTGDKANRAVWDAKQAYWGARGYILIAVNYRMLPAAAPQTQARDIAAALRFVQKGLPGWGGDPGRLLLMGHSAGGHLVALVSTDAALRSQAGLAPWRGTVVLDSAALDVVGQMTRPRVPRYMKTAFGSDPAAWPAVSPMARIAGPTGPFLLICSTRRRLSCDEAQRFAVRVRDAGGQAHLVPLDLSHREVNTTLGTPGAPATVAVDRYLKGLGLP
ncbi:alpha/beta hydrolase [Actibacterium sp. D379-3]